MPTWNTRDGTIYGMRKTTVYLPDELELELEAETTAIGISKAEFIRQSIAEKIAASSRPKRDLTLPVFNSGRGRSLTPEEMDDAIYQQIKKKVGRR